MRLRGISSIAKAAVPKGLNLNRILCIKTERTVRNDCTIAHNREIIIRTEKPQKEAHQLPRRKAIPLPKDHPWRRLLYVSNKRKKVVA